MAVTIAVVLLGLAIAALAVWIMGLLVFGAIPGTWIPLPATTAAGDEGWLGLGKVALTIAAGVGGAVALVVAYRKQGLAERHAFLDRYATAAEQLGSSSATVRLAGIYALANLADQWEEQRQQCVEVLCAHLRLQWAPH